MPFLSVEKYRGFVAVLHKEQPDVVVCTGVLAMIPLMHGSQALRQEAGFYIESFAKVTSATLTGKLLYHYADRFYVQWTQMKEIYPDAICWGEFIRMIFVTTGSQKFQFNRLLQG